MTNKNNKLSLAISGSFILYLIGWIPLVIKFDFLTYLGLVFTIGGGTMLSIFITFKLNEEKKEEAEHEKSEMQA